jgi:hypothetical protein
MPKTLSKKEVIDALGKSKRTVETYIATGRLPCHYVTGANGRQAAFDPADVARLKQDLETPMYRTTEAPAPAEAGNGHSAPGLALRSADPFAGLAAHLAKLAAAFPSPPPTVGQWLTLDEAAERSGLPKSWLLAQARSGADFAMNVGSPKKAVWRFRA